MQLQADHLHVSELWKKGEVTLPLGFTSPGFFDYAKLRKVANAGLGIIAEENANSQTYSPKLSNALRTQRILVFYPLPEHAEIFAKNAVHCKINGPGHYYPGSVGALQLFAHSNGFGISFIQGSFKGKTLKAKDRSTAFKYLNWKEHLLNHVFNAAKEEKMATVSLLTQNMTHALRKDFEKTALANGFKVIESGNVLLARLQLT